MSCPGIPGCPLYEIGHDGRYCHLGCVDDLAQPCRVKRGASFDRMWAFAVKAMFSDIRRSLGMKSSAALHPTQPKEPNDV